MGFLISGRLEAVLGTLPDQRTLQVIIPGTFMGELGLLSGKIHSRTIIAKQPSLVSESLSADTHPALPRQVALLTRETLLEIEKNDIVGPPSPLSLPPLLTSPPAPQILLCTLQKLALKTAAWRSCQLMLFSAGSLGPR
jgi:hypothetical protein